MDYFSILHQNQMELRRLQAHSRKQLDQLAVLIKKQKELVRCFDEEEESSSPPIAVLIQKQKDVIQQLLHPNSGDPASVEKSHTTSTPPPSPSLSVETYTTSRQIVTSPPHVMISPSPVISISSSTLIPHSPANQIITSSQFTSSDAAPSDVVHHFPSSSGEISPQLISPARLQRKSLMILMDCIPHIDSVTLVFDPGLHRVGTPVELELAIDLLPLISNKMKHGFRVWVDLLSTVVLPPSFLVLIVCDAIWLERIDDLHVVHNQIKSAFKIFVEILEPQLITWSVPHIVSTIVGLHAAMDFMATIGYTMLIALSSRFPFDPGLHMLNTLVWIQLGKGKVVAVKASIGGKISGIAACQWASRGSPHN